jgi:regulator of protease activity HflC (stomatin/prohibitin superfamily)
MAASMNMTDGEEKAGLHDLPKKSFGPMDLCVLAGSIACCPFVCMSSWQQVNERQEAVVLSFGRYNKTVKEPGMTFINCIGTSVRKVSTADVIVDLPTTKIVDKNGNPLLVSGLISYKVVNSYKAAIDVQNYAQFIMQQGTAVLKNVVSRYPYEDTELDDVSLKGEQNIITKELMQELQALVNVAGLEVKSFRFNELSYAPEIAAQMLKKQQAFAQVEARATIVRGAVETAHGAITSIEAKGFALSDGAKEKLVVNLLTVMTSESDVTPTITL